MSESRLHVVAAVLQRDQQYFVQQRQPGKHLAGLWEFPGGKVEPGESAWSALVRELQEELGITATRGEPLIQLTHVYPDRNILLDVWRVISWDGELRALEQQVVAWRRRSSLLDMPLLPADEPVIRALALPHQVLVTPDCQTTHEEFLTRLEAVVRSRGIRLCVLRQNQLRNREYEELAAGAQKILHTLDCKLVLHGSIDLRAPMVRRLGAHGLHVTASTGTALKNIPTGLKRLSMSCHSEQELRHASALGMHFALLGPVRTTGSCSGVNPLGWNEFKRLVVDANTPVYATGGMRPDDEVHSRLEGAQGIAANSALWNRSGAERSESFSLRF